MAKTSSMSSSRPHITSPPLDGRVCVLTGGRGFLGQIFSRALLAAGAKVAILDVAPVVTEPMTDMLQLYADITDEISLKAPCMSFLLQDSYSFTKIVSQPSI